jgi:hypothetical protein
MVKPETARIRLGAALATILIPALLFVAGWAWIQQVSAARETTPPQPGQFVPGDPIPGQNAQPTPVPRERPAGMADGPEISFIESSNATCYREAPSTNRCYIGWQPLYVSADPGQYIISMTVSINNQLRGFFSGFFQNSMYIPFEQLAPGFLVDCGLPGSGSNPNLGKTYAYTIHARETSGLASANYGSVTCPADIVAATDVSLSGPATGYVGVPVQFTASVSPPNASQPITYTWTATSQTTSSVLG